MRKVLLLASLLICLKSSAQYHEISFHFRNGILLNNSDVRSSFDDRPIADVRNTVQQSIGGSYTYVLQNNILLSAGLDAGYEYYKAFIDFPFETYGFDRDPLPGKHYRQNKYVPFIQANFNIGYRFGKIGGLVPEIRLGQIAHMPVASREMNIESLARPSVASRGTNFTLNGAYGGSTQTSKIELINSLYVGASIPGIFSNLTCVNIGLQFQRQFIGRGKHNYFEASYYDGNDNYMGGDIFSGSHTSLSFVLGLVLKAHKPNPQMEAAEDAETTE